ncbi:dTMP kinase [Nanoarchaeota archaeon]
MSYPNFFVVEGPDGCGKSTQAKLIAFYLRQRGKDVLLTAEPTGLYKSIMKELDVGPFDNALLTARVLVADRMQHCRGQIIPALERGRIVVCDRFEPSTFAYQMAQGVSKDDITKLHDQPDFIRPSTVFLIDLPFEEAQQRIKTRGARSEFESDDYQRNVHRHYDLVERLMPHYGKRFVRISGEGNPQKVFEKIKESLDQRMYD